ncbi:phospholipase D family protein [Variovorax sp. YR216]|uniref:phospholipase D family protein n=1 Tax=Variovorax sp. YR216 TaxID=1882828 RepID=UPI00089BD6C6|nr:phospholipase D family protein [Variovorax sp. YR216]SEA94392.1 Phosphatidylserine/phosphatidylglycerophosphate/cardiolipin synthase [Variovorax sp. YR216]
MPRFFLRLFPIFRCLAFAFACLLTACASVPPRTITPYAPGLPPSPATELGRLTAGFRTDPDGLSGARVLPQAAFALDARLALIRRARSSLDLQYYLIGNDKTGKLIARELRDAAMRGVRVRLLLDDFYTANLDPMLLGLAAHPNVEIRLFNPFVTGREHTATRWMNFAADFRRLNHRMHNKLFIADGALAVVGGRNLADEYFLRASGANFIDLDVMLAGPVVADLQTIFDNYWNSEVVYPLHDIVQSTRPPDALRAKFDTITSIAEAPLPPVTPESDMFGEPPVSAAIAQGKLDLSPTRATAIADSPNKALVATDGDDPRQHRPPTVAERMRAMFEEARSEINIISPYFIPGEEGMERIARLRARGIRITVATNSLADTDEPLVNINYNRFRVEMLKLGVSLYEVSSEQMKRSLNLRKVFRESRGALHAKLALVDREWALVGSLNFDPRSAYLNTELGVRLDSYDVAHRLLDAFQIDNVESVYEVRLRPGTDSIQWVTTDGENIVLDQEPDANVLVQLKLLLFSWFVPTDLL